MVEATINGKLNIQAVSVLDMLPIDAICLIFSHFAYREINLSLPCLSQKWHQLSLNKESNLWKRILMFWSRGYKSQRVVALST